MTALLAFFYFLAAISIFLGLLSLRGGVRFVRYLQRELAAEPAEYTPFATVFVPCRGVDDGLRKNILSLFRQDYPAFEIIFVSDSAGDPAFAVIEEARRTYDQQTGPVIQTMVAGPATDSGQKVHNLRSAVAAADSRSKVLVFTDTDARPQEWWLRFLIAALKDNSVGAATGYRWFLPRGGFPVHVQSVWNAAIASALGKNTERNFCWGGATAIRRETFDQLRIAERWRGTLSDDFIVTRVVHEANFPIKFVPQCLTPSYNDTGLRELLEFTTRQLKITRVYAPHLWRSVFIGSAIFSFTFFGGLALVIGRIALGLRFAPSLVLLLLIFAMGAVKSHLRLRAVAMIIQDPRMKKLAMTVAHVTLWPLASLLFLYNAMAAAISRRINWRGITYELKSPTETVILARDP